MSDELSLKERSKLLEKLKLDLAELKDVPGGVMPALQLAQKVFGYLPKDVIEVVAKVMDKPLSEVYGVATFYSQYSLEPKGKYNIDVCTGTSCYSLGGEKVLSKVKEYLGIGVGERTADGKFYLASSKCHGLCALSPVMTVNDDTYVNVKIDDIPNILDKYR